MEKYLSAVSEMYSQFKKQEDPELSQYVGRLAKRYGEKMEVVGYSRHKWAEEPLLIVDASQSEGWTNLGPLDVVFKKCESYLYAGINNLID